MMKKNNNDDFNEEIDYEINIDDKIIDSSKLSLRAYFKYWDTIGIDEDMHK